MERSPALPASVGFAQSQASTAVLVRAVVRAVVIVAAVVVCIVRWAAKHREDARLTVMDEDFTVDEPDSRSLGGFGTMTNVRDRNNENPFNSTLVLSMIRGYVIDH
jgi:uncharacterized membrane protein